MRGGISQASVDPLTGERAVGAAVALGGHRRRARRRAAPDPPRASGGTSLVAEGGTGAGHMVTIARSRDDQTGPSSRTRRIRSSPTAARAIPCSRPGTPTSSSSPTAPGPWSTSGRGRAAPSRVAHQRPRDLPRGGRLGRRLARHRRGPLRPVRRPRTTSSMTFDGPACTRAGSRPARTPWRSPSSHPEGVLLAAGRSPEDPSADACWPCERPIRVDRSACRRGAMSH